MKKVVYYQCEYCGTIYKTEKEAEECSEKEFPIVNVGDIVEISSEFGLYKGEVCLKFGLKCNQKFEIDTHTGLDYVKVSINEIKRVIMPAETYKRLKEKIKKEAAAINAEFYIDFDYVQKDKIFVKYEVDKDVYAD